MIPCVGSLNSLFLSGIVSFFFKIKFVFQYVGDLTYSPIRNIRTLSLMMSFSFSV